MKKTSMIIAAAIALAAMLGGCGNGRLGAPPELTLSCGGESITVSYSGASWNSPKSAFIADPAHILDCGELLQTLHFSSDSSTAEMEFTAAPARVSVVSYASELLGSARFDGERSIAADGLTFELSAEDSVYIVRAEWDMKASRGGRAEYYFRAAPDADR